VLCKAPFPNAGDARVAHRLEQDRWAWYYRTTLRTVIQACGRIVRSPDDHGATYVADDALLDVFERARTDMPPWFREQVDAMSAPEIPGLPIEAAGSATAASSTPTSTDTVATGSSSDGAASSSTSRATSSGTTGTAESDPETDGEDDPTPDDGGAEKGERSAKGSPLGDVWGDG
jgi:hypothetical protein